MYWGWLSRFVYKEMTIKTQVRKLVASQLIRLTTLEDEYGESNSKLHLMPSEPHVYTSTLSNILYSCSPQGEFLMTKSRKIIGESLRCGIYKSKQGLKVKEVYQKVNKVIPGYCSVFRNSPIKNFGHSLIQFIPRCYLLNQPEYRGLGEIKLLCSEPLTKLEKFCLPKILPPNVRITPVPSGLYHVENLIFPSFLQADRANGALPSSYIKEVHSKFLPERPRQRKNRIYISRSKYADINSRHVLNEDELVSELSQLGFKQYRTEEMSIPEQIDLFYDAEVVIGANGSALANLLYSEKATLLELNPCKGGMRFFKELCESMGHYRLCWEGSGSKFHSNFDVDISEILKMLSSSGFDRKT